MGMNAFLEKMAQLDPNPVAHTEAGTPESGVTDEAYQNYVGTQKTDTGLEKYPNLKAYTHALKRAERPIIGRAKEMDSLLAAMDRPELCNVILLGDAGSGKTALVQGTMLRDSERLYLEVDLSRMIADVDTPSQLGDKLKSLFAEVQLMREDSSTEVVLFMDEFHQIVEISKAAVEALKPLLADSGTRGVRVIAATTFIEFRDYIQPNQALVERLQRINLDPPDKQTTVKILEGMAKRYGVDNLVSKYLLGQIYDLTNRYIPANSQPRKSILILDSMVGWYRHKHRNMNMRLLADVIYESEGINIAFRVDAMKIKEELDKHVFAQEFATSIIESRLQVCVADLNDKSKPMASLLFTGPTGVGKLVADYEMVPVYTEDGSVTEKRHGDLVPGDMVFDRMGRPTKILGCYPHQNIDMYRVILTDGRTLDVGADHLWTVYTAKQYRNYKYGKSPVPRVLTTKELLAQGVVQTYPDRDSRRHLKWHIPMNQAVQYAKRDYSVHPYVIGALLGNGCLTLSPLSLSSVDMEVVDKVACHIGAGGVSKKSDGNVTWNFNLPEQQGIQKYFQTKDVLSEYPEMCVKSREKRIPRAYFYGSVEQRWELIRGLFDTDGTVSADDRVRVTFSTFSQQLASDVQYILWSLGISSKIRFYSRRRIGSDGQERDLSEYVVSVKCSDEDKKQFFSLSRKRSVIDTYMRTDKVRKKDYSWVGISDIVPIGVQNAQCIYVDNEEHLYQAGSFVVTHNTEVSKQLAGILFDDPHRLIRFDMTEYANPDSLDHFRAELTNRVWARPFSIVLLDEIEKACSPITRLLLQVLDDGRLMDENNREVPFTNCYIIMTTNAGAEVYELVAQYAKSDTGDGSSMMKYDKIIRRSIVETTGENKFPPELLGRIDCIVPFQPLSELTQEKIVQQKLDALTEEVREKHGVELMISKEVIPYICWERGTIEASEGGARRLISTLNTEVVAAVSRALNQYPGEDKLLVDVTGNMAHRDKYQLESEAYIVVKVVR